MGLRGCRVFICHVVDLQEPSAEYTFQKLVLRRLLTPTLGSHLHFSAGYFVFTKQTKYLQ